MTSEIEAIALLDDPTRRRLYEWVVAQPTAVGREEAASAVGVSRALAAFHLDRLAAGGLLDTEFRRLSRRSGPGAGRPAKLYRQSERELEVSLPARRYGLAAEVFARALEASAQTDPAREAATEAGVALARRAPGGRSPRQRLLNVLNGSGYQPIVDDDGTVRLRNCPFHALAASHRDLTCGMNLALAEGISQGLGQANLRPELDPQPGWCCVVFKPAGGKT
jgi:predicted ArsR family transcriptional regulator